MNTHKVWKLRNKNKSSFHNVTKYPKLGSLLCDLLFQSHFKHFVGHIMNVWFPQELNAHLHSTHYGIMYKTHDVIPPPPPPPPLSHIILTLGQPVLRPNRRSEWDCTCNLYLFLQHYSTFIVGERCGLVVERRNQRSGVRNLPPPCCVLKQDTLLPESTGNTQEAVAPSRHD